MAQQCGQVFVADTAPFIANYYGPGSATNQQIPYVQVATWNDYEEGTEVETGIDSCWRFGTPTTTSGSGGTISWSLSDTQVNGYLNAVNGTIHNFTLWYALPNDSQQHLLSLTSSVGGSARSVTGLNSLFSAAGATHQTYNVYVELVGMPMIQNEMSPYAQYTY